jgi:hypothetical protein
MQDRPEQAPHDNPLRHLTAAQFMALGGSAVVYVRSIKGSKLSEFMEDVSDDVADEDFHLIVSADGQPLLVADTKDAVTDWLADKDLGIVALH